MNSLLRLFGFLILCGLFVQSGCSKKNPPTAPKNLVAKTAAELPALEQNLIYEQNQPKRTAVPDYSYANTPSDLQLPPASAINSRRSD